MGVKGIFISMLVIIHLALVIVHLFDLRTKSKRSNKGKWALMIVFLPIVGVIAYDRTKQRKRTEIMLRTRFYEVYCFGVKASLKGNLRIRLPVAAKMALSTAGTPSALDISPTPPGPSTVVSTK